MKNYNNYIKENYWGSGKNNDFDGQYIDNENDSYKYIGYNLFNVEEVFDLFEEIQKQKTASILLFFLRTICRAE